LRRGAGQAVPLQPAADDSRRAGENGVGNRGSARSGNACRRPRHRGTAGWRRRPRRPQRSQRRARRRSIPQGPRGTPHHSRRASSRPANHRAAHGPHLARRRDIMAVIHDVMPAFELFQPASISDALTLLNRHGSDAWVMGGGLDSFDWLKDRIKRPSVVVDLSQIEGLRGVKEQNGGLEIGATTTLTEVVRHPVVRDRFGLLMEAAELVASPQIRNQGTIGGNVSQDTRCWYYRSGW